MRRWAWVVAIAVQAALTVGVVVAIRAGAVPLGVRGEWEWLRVSSGPEPVALGIATASVGLYAAYAALAMRSIARGGKAALWLAGLVPMAVVVGAAVQEGAPSGYGLAKWAIALHNPGSSGYYTVAKSQVRDLPGFLAAYPEWIKGQDALHIGTHPPGLFATSWGMLRAMEAHPGVARSVVGLFPGSLDLAFRSLAIDRPIPVADRAALAMTGLAVLVAGAATAVPLYGLARSRLSAPASWASASLWPLVPAGLMFQPAADAAFPLLATTALALAAWADHRPWLAAVAGVVLAVGAQFTLAFFPVGLVAAIVYLTTPGAGRGRRLALVAWTGVGFLCATAALGFVAGADPLAIWRANVRNHARFYEQYHRSYWAWVVEAPIELAVAIGLPTAAWIACGVRSSPRFALATAATLALLALSGKNLGEVARLWLPLMPPLVAWAGAGADRLGAGPIGLAAALALIGLQTLALQATIQVVYPV